jgi:hypothetical protein
MCFKENITFFKVINWCFFVIHAVLLTACVLVTTTRDTPLTLYYQMEVTHGTYIGVYPIYAAIMTHVFGVIFHFSFAMMGAYIVEHYISHNFTNPIKWVLQGCVDGAALIGLMLIHGFHQVESVVLVLVIYTSVIVLCYYQDHYMHPSNTFNPGKSPHTFAIPIHIMMILMIVAKANEHITDEESMKIAVVTLVSLALTLVSYILQGFQITYRSPRIIDDGIEKVDYDDDTEQAEAELDSVVRPTDQLDAMLDEVRRGIQYESYYYTNSALFTMTVTWFIITITQTDQVLRT